MRKVDEGSLTWPPSMCMDLALQIKNAKNHGHGQDAGTFNTGGHQRIAAGMDKKHNIRKDKNWTDKCLITKIKSKVKEMVLLWHSYNTIL
jgi:hypothetical protein